MTSADEAVGADGELEPAERQPGVAVVGEPVGADGVGDRQQVGGDGVGRQGVGMGWR